MSLSSDIELSRANDRDPTVTFHGHAAQQPAAATATAEPQLKPASTSSPPSTNLDLYQRYPLATHSVPEYFHAAGSHSTFAGAIIRYGDIDAKLGDTDTVDAGKQDHILTWIHNWWVQWRTTGLSLASRAELHLFTNRHIWRSAFIEFVGTCFLTIFAVGAGISVSAHPHDYSYPPTAVAILVGSIIPIMIFTTAPSSGGHLNSLITMATWMAGLCEFPRMVLYIAAQICGSIAGAYALRAMLSQPAIDATLLGMCLHGTLDRVTAFSCELFCSFILLFVAFGVALDPKQLQAVGPNFAPFIIGATMGLLIYITGSWDVAAPPGTNTGAIVNPTRCLGPAIAMGYANSDTIYLANGTPVHNFQWVYWVASIVASAMHAFLYRAIPPGYMAHAAAMAQAQAQAQVQAQAANQALAATIHKKDGTD